MRALLPAFVAVVVAPARAGAAPATTLTMRVYSATNLHIGRNEGASHWSEDITVTVELRGDGTLRAAVAGTRTDHELYVTANRSYNTDDVTTLKTTWTGTYKRGASTLELALALDADVGTRIKTSDGVAPEQLAYRSAAKRTTLRCTSERVTLDDVETNKKRAVDAWRCAPANADDLGELTYWLLGKTECISVGGGRMSAATYHPCKP